VCCTHIPLQLSTPLQLSPFQPVKKRKETLSLCVCRELRDRI
jgi:hypothetical protein